MRRPLIKKFFQWSFLRWLLLLPTLYISFYLAFLVFYFSSYSLQSVYFNFLDSTHRHGSGLSDSFFTLGIAGGLGLLVAGTLISAVLTGISFDVREKMKSFVKFALAVVLLWSCVVFIGIFANAQPDKKLPKLVPVWTVEHVPIGLGITERHDIHEMVFANPDRLVINTGGQLISLVAQTGQPLATTPITDITPHEFPSPPSSISSDSGYVFASPSGKIIFAAAGQLRTLSAELEPLGTSLSVPNGEIKGSSPSGAHIGWQHYSSTAPKTTFIDTETLKPAESFADCNVWTMTDHSVAESVDLVKEGGIPAVNVCDPGTSSHILYRDHDRNYGQFVYLNNELMLMLGRRFLLLDSTGKTIASDDWPDQHVDFAGVSRYGSRFAIAIERWGWGDPAEINKVTLVIYDTASFRPIAEIPSAWVCAFSPDGKAVAASFGTTTSYYRLP